MCVDEVLARAALGEKVGGKDQPKKKSGRVWWRMVPFQKKRSFGGSASRVTRDKKGEQKLDTGGKDASGVHEENFTLT